MPSGSLGTPGIRFSRNSSQITAPDYQGYCGSMTIITRVRLLIVPGVTWLVTIITKLKITVLNIVLHGTLPAERDPSGHSPTLQGEGYD